MVTLLYIWNVLMPFNLSGIFNIRVGCESKTHCVTWVSRKFKYLESFDNLAPKWTWKAGQVESNFIQHIYSVLSLKSLWDCIGKKKKEREICMITVLIYISFFYVKSINSVMYHLVPINICLPHLKIKHISQ